MATKHRRARDWTSSSSNDTDESDDNDIIKRMESISYVRREKEKKSKKTKEALNNLCDSDDNSGDRENTKRPFLSNTISKNLKKGNGTISGSSSSEESSSRTHKKVKTKNKKSNNCKSGSHSDSSEFQKPKENNKFKLNIDSINAENSSSEATSGTEYKNDKSKNKKLSKCNLRPGFKKSKEKKKLKLNTDSIESDSSSSETNNANTNSEKNCNSGARSSSSEFQKPKEKSKFNSNTDAIEYTHLEVPTKSDGQNIPVETEQRKQFDNFVNEALDHVKSMSEDLKFELTTHRNYFMKKQVNVVNDTSFVARKILNLYDLTVKQLNKCRNNFHEHYSLWLDSCSDKSHNSKQKNKPSKDSNCNEKNAAKRNNKSLQQKNENKKKGDYSKDAVALEENDSDSKKSCSENELLEFEQSQGSGKKDSSLGKNSSCESKESREESEGEKDRCEVPKENDLDKVSDCDSEEIFSAEESRSKEPPLAKSPVSSEEDLFESTASEVANTPAKSPILISNCPRKTLLINTQSVEPLPSATETAADKLTGPEVEAEHSDDSERAALKDLLEDCDSELISNAQANRDTSDESVESSCSGVTMPQKISKINDAMKNVKNEVNLIKQTKKRNSIYSDSSTSNSAAEEEADRRKTKNLRRSSGNGVEAPTRKLRRQRVYDIQKNRHYKTDKKLRMRCQVMLERLSPSILEKYSRALDRSKKYVANKKFYSLTNLDGLEGKKKKKCPDNVESSTDSEKAKSVKAKQKKKDEKRSLKDHMADENNVESDEEMSDKHSTDETPAHLSQEETHVEPDISQEAEEKAAEALLNSSSSNSSNEPSEDESEMITDKKSSIEEKTSKSEKSMTKDSKIRGKEDETSKEENNKKKVRSDWKEDKLLKFKLTDTEDEEEKGAKTVEKILEIKSEKTDGNSSNEDATCNEVTPTKTPEKKTKKQRKKRRVLDSDSDVKQPSSEDDSAESDKGSAESDKEKKDKKKKVTKRRKKSSDSDTSSSEKKPKSKRRRIKKVASDSDSDEQDSPGKGRKNIRKVLKDKHVADDTKKAAQDEEERLKRIAERQKLFNEMYDARLAGEAKVDKLVLDFDEETKKELVVVDKELVKRLKPHQAQGIKFMWDACFESLKQIEKSEGSGCIIAHCMGLGKTFQVVTLTYTLLTHEETGVDTVMIVCPLSTVLNWVNEFKIWLKYVKNGDEIEVYELTKLKKNTERKYMLESWKKTGGVLIIGYEMFRNLTSTGKKMRKAMQESIMRSLVDPGADMVVCDEGHLLKNEESALSKAMRLVKTKRRIVLTGTPLQNNLKEYHCMVQFVKPNLLGTKKEFLNRFVNPITNGQFDDSTPYDVKIMKKRAHVLHKMLEGSVQRFDYSVLTPFLPPKQEYVIFVRLTDVQIKMYQHYLDNFARRFGQKSGSLFADFQELQRIWTHPYVLRLNAARIDRANEKKRLEASDSEGSLKDFIDDGSESDTSVSSIGSDSSDVQCVDSDAEKAPVKTTRSTRLNPKEEPEIVPIQQESAEESAWWSKFVEEKHFEDIRSSTKLLLLFGILKESEHIGDKVLVFSQSLYSLTLIEQFLNLIDQETQNGVEADHLDKHSGSWALGLDYFRLDGSTSAENRSAWCKIFNNPNNTRARLFLISTRAGGLGINLTAANRVIIFDASWNPSHDVQSIFRVYRFGQKKPCYIYRFLAAGTMEEKIYNRQVTKLSLACRVVDEQQIERHYSNNDLAELYQFESYEGTSVTLNLPKDRLLAEIFLKYKDYVYNYHEHDSLLENKEEEELDEEERKQAWIEYEEEKQGKRQMMNTGNLGFNPFLMNLNSFPELENIKMLIQKDYPNLPPEHLETVARQAVYDMYRFVDQQTMNQNLNPFGMGQVQSQNVLGVPNMQMQQQQQQPQPQPQPQLQPQQQQPFNQSHLLNMLNQPQMNYSGVNHMPVYSGRGRPPKHLSMNSIMNMRMQTPLQTQMQPQQPQMHSSRNNDDVQILNDMQATLSNNKPASNINNVQEE